MITAAHDLIWVENRRTPKVKTKGEKYEPTEAEGRIVKRRAATAEEEKVISRGDWVRVNEKGEKPSDAGYKRKKSKVRPGPHTNSLDPMGTAMALVEASDARDQMISLMFALAGPEADGYTGVTHAGVAVVALDSGRVLLAQRAMDATDDAAVQETFEFPGGGLDEGEEAWAGAMREFCEETRLPWPEGEVVGGWRSDDGIYQGFVYAVEHEFPVENWTATDEVQTLTWFTREDMESHSNLRPEVEAQTDWDMIFETVSGNKEDDVPLTAATQVGTADEYLRVGEDEEPAYAPGEFDLDEPIPVHGVIAPEEMESGDKRAFGAGSMTRRPLRLPFSDQRVAIGGHDGSVVVGSVDRMMRKDGLIHWEGSLIMSEDTESLVTRMQHFGGRYGVSVDGDQGSMDEARSKESGTMWFDQVRAAGLTAVAIPAFHEAYVAFGRHPEMPKDDNTDTVTAAAYLTGEMIGASTFDRGPGWVTDPVETRRIHAYWTKKGEPGYAKIGWGTRGDFTRAKRLIGAKIAEHSPASMKYLNQIIAQWHFDALGYWPGDLDMPGNKTSAEARAERVGASNDVDYTEVTRLMTEGLDRDDIEASDEDPGEDGTAVWEAVLVSSAVSGNARPALDYFHQHPSMIEDVWAAESGALIIEDPDEFGFQRTWGYAAEWGVCHVGMDGRCVEPPKSGSDDYPAFHLGRTRTNEGYVYTGVLTYGVGHRDADTMLAESPDQAYFDNVKNAWASVRVGENERGIWFSGVVLPKIDAGDIVKIEASGQVSGEWLAGAMRACLTVNVPGFPNERPSAVYDANGNVLAMAASAFGGLPGAPCSDQGADDPIGDIAAAVMERIEARAKMDALRNAEAKRVFADLKNTWKV